MSKETKRTLTFRQFSAVFDVSSVLANSLPQKTQ
jgi:hypothetical protein